MIDSADALIAALGGTTNVAALLGVSLSTVSGWRNRGLPAWTCERLRREAVTRSLDVAAEVFEIRPRAARADQ